MSKSGLATGGTCNVVGSSTGDNYSRMAVSLGTLTGLSSNTPTASCTGFYSSATTRDPCTSSVTVATPQMPSHLRLTQEQQRFRLLAQLGP